MARAMLFHQASWRSAVAQLDCWSAIFRVNDVPPTVPMG